VLDELADAQEFARLAEGLLGGLEGRDGLKGAIRAVEVPREEAREVLEGAQDFVASNWGVLVGVALGPGLYDDACDRKGRNEGFFQARPRLCIDKLQ